MFNEPNSVVKLIVAIKYQSHTVIRMFSTANLSHNKKFIAIVGSR